MKFLKLASDAKVSLAEENFKSDKCVGGGKCHHSKTEKGNPWEYVSETLRRSAKHH